MCEGGIDSERHQKYIEYEHNTHFENISEYIKFNFTSSGTKLIVRDAVRKKKSNRQKKNHDYEDISYIDEEK